MSLFVEGKFFKEAGANGGGGGGSDPHNLGYYADLTALQTAHPTASNGDFAILGSTDTIWVWDSGTSAWKDTDQKGQVESVNGRTGAVTVSEVPSQTGYSGRVLGTDGFVAGWIEPERVQRDAMPVANEDEANNIYEYVGTTDANYTNGYFYKCVNTTAPSSATAMQTTGSSLSDVDVNVSTFESEEQPSGNETVTFNYKQGEPTFSNDWSYDDGGTGEPQAITISGDIGQFLLAKGVSAATLIAAGTFSIFVAQIDGVLIVDADEFEEIETTYEELGQYLTISGTFSTDDGTDFYIDTLTVTAGQNAWYKNDTTAVTISDYGITYTGIPVVNDVITVVYTAAVTTYAWEAVEVQPTPEALPDQTGQNGKFLTTNGTTASWGTVGGLPSQTGNAGKFLTTDGTDASWSDKPLANKATGLNSLSVGSATTTNFTISFGQGINTSKNLATSFGYGTRVDGANGLAIGYGSEAKGNLSMAVGSQMIANAVNAIQIGAIANGRTATNSDANTFKVANANGNFELMNANGNLPADRLASTTGLADGNYRLRLTMASGVPTLEWVAE